MGHYLNLNYEKIRAKSEHGGNPWTSYSDLFLSLSVVFLLLYVVASFRSGTLAVASRSAIQQAKNEADELKKQIKVYEVLKEDYLKEGASKDELKMYQELMGKLTLLENESNREQEALFVQAKEAQEKQQQLNRYQAMIKNIVNANMLAQSDIKKRDDIIDKQEKDIENLNTLAAEKEKTIRANNTKIIEIEDQLQTRIKEVQEAYRSKKRSKEKLQKEISKLQKDSSQRILALKEENRGYLSQLETAKTQIAQKSRQAEQLLATLNKKESEFNGTIAELQLAHAESVRREKQAFEQGIIKAQLSTTARIEKEQAYRIAVERKNRDYNQRLAQLNQELDKTRSSIKNLTGKYQVSINSLKRSNDSLQKNLQASIEKQNAQKKLAQRIKDEFARSGISADVDMQTGDVLINFAHEYFDIGSSSLKMGMRQTLEKMIPVYAKSLFQDNKVARKINSVEIIGFASPTYQGHYVNPDSLSPGDRQAVNYNMDLSYQRAKSIFEYVFDPKKMQFTHQKTLLPLVKVTGRSYLATERLRGRTISSSMNIDEYCQNFDCKKSQRVIIKFNLSDQ